MDDGDYSPNNSKQAAAASSSSSSSKKPHTWTEESTTKLFDALADHLPFAAERKSSRNPEGVDAAWSKVANHVGASSQTCQRHWDALKAEYDAWKKKKQETGDGDNPPNPKLMKVGEILDAGEERLKQRKRKGPSAEETTVRNIVAQSLASGSPRVHKAESSDPSQQLEKKDEAGANADTSSVSNASSLSSVKRRKPPVGFSDFLNDTNATRIAQAEAQKEQLSFQREQLQFQRQEAEQRHQLRLQQMQASNNQFSTIVQTLAQQQQQSQHQTQQMLAFLGQTAQQNTQTQAAMMELMKSMFDLVNKKN